MTGKGTGISVVVAFMLGAMAGSLGVIHYHRQVGLSDSTDVKQVLDIQRRDLDKELVRMDISAVNVLSTRQKAAYVSYVDSAAMRYKIPHLFLHAICSVESGYNPEAVHPEIRVKGKTTRAIGLTGIVWEYHSANLMAESIATARAELTEPRVNIMASAYILNGMMRDIVHDYSVKGKVLVDTSVFSEIVRRYYGAYSEAYKQKMMLKIRDTAGKQWLRRVAQDMLIEFQSSYITSIPAVNLINEVPHVTSVRKAASRRPVLARDDSGGARRSSVFTVAGKPAPER